MKEQEWRNDQEGKLSRLLKETSLSIWQYDENTGVLTLLGGSLPDYTIPKRWENLPESIIKDDYVHPDDAEVFAGLLLHAGTNGSGRAIRMKRLDGAYGWVKLYFSPSEPDGCAIGIFEDIDEQKQIELLFQQETEYRNTLTADALSSYEFNLTQNRLLSADQASLDFLGVKLGDSYDHVAAAALERAVVPEDRVLFAAYIDRDAMRKAFEDGKYERHLEYRSTDYWGETLWVCHTAHLIREPQRGDICCFIYIKNIDARKRNELAIQERAERDSLTGLFNRSALRSHTEAVLNTADSEFQAVFFMIDIDCFKQINDQLGHWQGDRILIEFSRRMKEAIGTRNVLGRIGGDEFAAVVWGAGEEEAPTLAKGIGGALQWVAEGFPVSGSIGAALFPQHGRSFDELYQKADSALYTAKKSGKGGYAVYGNGEQSRNEKTVSSAENPLIDEVGEIVYISDPKTYELLYVNKVGCEAVGLTPGSYQGKKCYKMLHNMDAPCSFCTNDRLKHGEFYIWEHTNTFLERHFLLKDKLIDWGGRPVRMEVAVDITDKENISQGLESRLEIERALLGCIRALAGAKSLEDAVALALKSLGEFYGADRAYILEFDLKRGLAFNTYEWCAPMVEPQLDMLQNIPLECAPDWQTAIHTQQPLLLNDLSQPADERLLQEYELLKGQGIHSLYGAPFCGENDLNGFVGVDNPRVHLGDVSLLESLSYFLMNEIIRRRMENNMRFLSYHDRLTGLLNRNRYVEVLAQYRSSPPVSLGVIAANINGLKQINRAYGHGRGDRAVRRVGEILKRRFKDHAFRLSGDEFLVLAGGIASEAFYRECEALRKELGAIENGVALGFVWDESNVSAERIIAHADELLQAEKQAYYSSREAAEDRWQPIRMRELEQAIADGCFQMYLQPIVDIETGRICRAEALVRYYDEEHGMVAPDLFIPFLEKNRMIGALDFFLFEEACRALSRWEKEGRPPIPVSVNCSRVTLLKPQLTQKLLAACRRCGISPGLVEIEITERAGDMERETFLRIGRALKEAGFSISLDDFGSEYSSTFILPLLPWDTLKIDRSLTLGMAADKRTRMLVQSVTDLCAKFGIAVVVEGVETREQCELLRRAGCRFVQGYYFSRPLPLKEFEELDLLNSLPQG